MKGESKEVPTKIYCIMSEDDWFGGVTPIGFFTTKEKALTYKHEAQKDKKRWNHYRLFIQEYDVDREYERINF